MQPFAWAAASPLRMAAGPSQATPFAWEGLKAWAVDGVELWSIQLLDRWGSEAVRRYLAEAHLDVASRRAAAASTSLAGLDIADLLAKLRNFEVPPEAIQCPAARTHLQQEAEQASRVAESSACLVNPLWVANLSSGVAHKVLLRASSAGTFDVTHCGWKFGGHRDAGLPVDREPTVYRQVCARCDPALRARLRAAA